MPEERLTKNSLEEYRQHGTAIMPISLHHTIIPAGYESALYLHWHEEFEFLILKKGNIIFQIGNASFTLSENQAVFINSNQLHSAKTIDKQGCEFYAVVFHYSFLSNSMNNVSFQKYIKPFITNKLSFPIYFTCESIYQNELLEILDSVILLYESNIVEYELFLKGRLLEIWQLLYNHSSVSQKPDKEYKINRIQPVLDYINTNYSDDISLSDLANIIHLSEGQFCRSFKEIMGFSPITYLTRHRILKSCELLIESEKKIAEIAILVGYSNISYFNRAFLSVIGCTPSNYRVHFEH